MENVQTNEQLDNLQDRRWIATELFRVEAALRNDYKNRIGGKEVDKRE